MTFVQSSIGERVRAAIGSCALTGALGYALFSGLAPGMPGTITDALKVFEIAPETPPPPLEKVIPERIKSKRPEGAASPPNLKSKATEIVAPVPIIPLVVPTPVAAALKPGVGSDPMAGASDVPGPGTGSGGQGTGTGSGGSGDGDGGGGVDETPPRWVRGRLKDSDYPRSAGEAGISGTVSVRYMVGIDGRVSECEVTRSSGHAELDQITCRLIEERFRYKPSFDSSRRPVPSYITENHSWAVEDDPDPDADDRGR